MNPDKVANPFDIFNKESLGFFTESTIDRLIPSAERKLRFVPNALLLPHVGYVTAENYSIFYTQMIENLEACVSGKPIREIK